MCVYVCVRMCVCMLCVCMCVYKTILEEEITNLRGGVEGTGEELEGDKAVGKIKCT